MENMVPIGAELEEGLGSHPGVLMPWEEGGRRGCVGEVGHGGLEVSTQGGRARLASGGAAPAPAHVPEQDRQDHVRVASCTNSVIAQNRTFPSYLVPVKIPIPRYCFPGWVTHPMPEPGFNMSP